jgi:hypothetical protein
MDVDLRGGDVDPIDQGGQESTLTCCGQFAHYETSAANSWQYATVDDVPKAAKDWPQINFVIYHAAKQAFLVPPDDELTEFEKNGYIRWVSDLAAIPQKHGVSNVYGEIGSAFANPGGPASVRPDSRRTADLDLQNDLNEIGARRRQALPCGRPVRPSMTS